MTFPQYKNKHNKAPSVSPTYFTKGSKIHDKTAIFIYTRKILAYLKKELNAKPLLGNKHEFNSLGLYEDKKRGILIVHLPIGAPITSSATDELVSLGTKRFIIFGLAGSLRNDLTHGNVVLCSKSLRDEGSSYHYVRPKAYAHPTKNLKDKMKSLMEQEKIDFRVGPSWTIDAPYMETKSEIEHYAKKGILTVEMESSAMFSVVERRRHEGYNLEVVAIFLISDIVSESEKYKFINSNSDYKKYKLEDRVKEMANVFKKI